MAVANRNLVILDGRQYRISAPGGGSPKYKNHPTKLLDIDRGGAGDLLITQSGFFDRTPVFTLVCTLDDLAALDTSYNKVSAAGTPPADLLDYTDPEGTEWNPGTPSNNLIANPGFETAGLSPTVFQSWTQGLGDGSLVNEGVVTHSGLHAAKLIAGPSFNTYITQRLTGLLPNTAYTLTFYARGDGTNSGWRYLYDNVAASFLIADAQIGVTVASYQLVTLSFTTGASTASLDLLFLCPTVNAAFCYIDDVQIAGNAAGLNFNTGVIFEDKGEPVPISGRGWGPGNLFFVQVTIAVNSKNLLT